MMNSNEMRNNDLKNSVRLSTQTAQQDSTISHPACQSLDRKKLILLSSVCTFAYAGASFGWGPMQLMLENQGVYRSLCPLDDSETCPEQAARLLNL